MRVEDYEKEDLPNLLSKNSFPMKFRNPEVSIIIPFYKRADRLPYVLESLLAQKTSINFEILIVESSGKEATMLAQESFPQVKVFSYAHRLPPGAARNRGAQQARGTSLAFLDADAVPDKKWLDTLYARLVSSKNVSMVCGTVSLPSAMGTASHLLHWIEFSSFLPGLPSGFKNALCSCNLLISQADFLSSGGFNENMEMAEDLLFSHRIGEGLYFETAAGVRHYSHSTWDSIFSHLRRLGYWSGRFRAIKPVSGAWLRHIPILSFVLPLWRLPLILRRVFRSDFLEGIRATVQAPRLVLGLLVWTRGFYQGLNSTLPPDKDIA